ncbi:hypothetical protein J5N97_018107 [Dioscorea zingiberensis]|uniref:Uncharacterized protein n=1 Tax=Dioscorea zingiberensis TaxID=325984 RepID=A0A9D5HHB6_9LILI|nr:hypothetical protein J5N97_018107 [Dioscorea zingiberensis]
MDLLFHGCLHLTTEVSETKSKVSQLVTRHHQGELQGDPRAELQGDPQGKLVRDRSFGITSSVKPTTTSLAGSTLLFLNEVEDTMSLCQVLLQQPQAQRNTKQAMKGFRAMRMTLLCVNVTCMKFDECFAWACFV